MLASSEFTDAVWADSDRARAFGASGVPFFVFGEKFGVSGAQPVETFAQVIEMVGSSTHEACGPEGCAI